jgi:hypothetical protein
MKQGMIVGYVLLFYLNGDCQIYHPLLSAGFNTSGVYSLKNANVFSFSDNPASLGGADHLLGGAMVMNYWMLQGLNAWRVAMSFPMAASGIGMMLEQSGDELYKEQNLELAYGKRLGKMDIGIGFDFINARAAGYGSIPFVSGVMGLRFHVDEKITAGWALGLPFLGYSGKTNSEKAPQYFRMGFGYQIEKDLLISFQVEKQPGIVADIFGCIEYGYLDHFIFSVGVHSAEGSFVFIAGWKKNRLSIEPCLLYEPVPGFSPGLMLLWEAKNKTE